MEAVPVGLVVPVSLDESAGVTVPVRVEVKLPVAVRELVRV